MNGLKTALLLAVLTGLFLLVGAALGGQRGMVMAFGFAIVMNLFSYWFSDKIVLKLYRAREVSEVDAPELVQITRLNAQRAGLPMPRVYIIPKSTPNAFATGRNPRHAAVAVTEGIMQLLSRDELEGVICHELAHVQHRDILTSTIAATIAGAISMLAYIARWGAIFGGYGGRDRDSGGGIIGLLAMAIVAPIAAMFIQMAISRSREYAADRRGAQICNQPLSLANALRKLHRGNERIPMQTNPSTAHMFIISPLRGRSIWNMFSTHPPVEERIKRLENMQYAI